MNRALALAILAVTRPLIAALVVWDDLAMGLEEQDTQP